MAPLRVGVVSRDPMIRLQAARAFDSAPASWIVRLFETSPNDADVVVFGPDADTGEGIVFDPADPNRVLEDVANAANTTRVLLVTSVQRGVGVTSVALHIAALSARKHRTCLIDCGERWGAASRLGLEETPNLASGDASDEAVELAAAPVPGGFRVLVTPAETGLEHVIKRAGRVFSRLIVDASDDLDRAAALETAAAAVLVMPPIPTSAKRARVVLESHPDNRWAIVINRLGPGGETTLRELERIVGRRIALELPCAPGLRDAEEQTSLLTTRLSRWVRRVDELYAALEGA